MIFFFTCFICKRKNGPKLMAPNKYADKEINSKLPQIPECLSCKRQLTEFWAKF